MWIAGSSIDCMAELVETLDETKGGYKLYVTISDWAANCDPPSQLVRWQKQ